MAQINPPKPLTASRPDDLREDNLTTAYARSSSFFDEHRTLIVGAVVAVVVLALAVIGYQTWQSERQEEASLLLGTILTEYEAGDWRAALDGTDATPGLLEIADEYGSTAAGEQATFFAADALYQLGEFAEAEALFEDYDGDGLLGASALAGRGAIAEQAGDYARAAEFYERAAGAFTSPASTPGYLLDAGRAFASAGDYAAAEERFERVREEYPETPEAQTAQAEIGRVLAAATAVGEPTGTVTAAPVDTTAAAPAGLPALTLE